MTRSFSDANHRLVLVSGTSQAQRAADAGGVDAELVAAVVAGQARAATALWDRYAPLVRGLMARTLGVRADVDDGVQEVFLKVFRALAKIEKPESLRSFIVAITLTTIRSELRRRRLRRVLGLEPSDRDVPEALAPSSDLGARVPLLRLDWALERLGPDQRMVFSLRYIEAMELTEVAEATGWSLATVKRLLARAKKRLWVLAERDPVLAPYLGQTEDES